MPLDGDLADPTIPKRPVLSDEAFASNRRTADALGKIKGLGDPVSGTGQACRASPPMPLTRTAIRRFARSPI